jgi:hypothetical protein
MRFIKGATVPQLLRWFGEPTQLYGMNSGIVRN